MVLAADDGVCLPRARACSACSPCFDDSDAGDGFIVQTQTCTTATVYSTDSAQIESKTYSPIEFAVM